MQQEETGKRAVFMSKMGNEFLMAPTYLMYLSMVLLGMFALDRFFPSLEISNTSYFIVAGIYLLFYFVSGYFSLGKNFQDIIVQDDQIEIINRVPGFRKQVAVKLDDIEQILFSESHLNLEQPRAAGILQEAFRHPERKWVEIHTKNKLLRCGLYGLNQHSKWTKNPTPSYEDLYAYLKTDRGLPVRKFSDRAA